MKGVLSFEPGEPQAVPERERRRRGSLPNTLPYTPGSETSQAAAKAMEPRAGTIRWAVLKALRDGGPATHHELIAEMRLAESTIRTRCNELVKVGLVKDSGHRRPSPSGQEATVWEAVDLRTNE